MVLTQWCALNGTYSSVNPIPNGINSLVKRSLEEHSAHQNGQHVSGRPSEEDVIERSCNRHLDLVLTDDVTDQNKPMVYRGLKEKHVV